MPTVQQFEELHVWQESRELVKQIYGLTKHFPKHETYALSSQMQRAAVSVMSNIAEGFERGSNTEFVQFLYVARASCGELRSQLYIALDLGYGSQTEIQDLRERCETLSRRLKTFVEYLKHAEIKGIKFSDGRVDYNIQQPETL